MISIYDKKKLKLIYLLFSTQGVQSGLTKLDVILQAQFDDHNSTVWRVCWNVTGTILASSGDDCYVRLWKGS